MYTPNFVYIISHNTQYVNLLKKIKGTMSDINGKFQLKKWTLSGVCGKVKIQSVVNICICIKRIMK